MEKQTLKTLIKTAAENSQYKKDIQSVALFGSRSSETERADSDIDILIEFTPTAKIGFFRFLGIQEMFEHALGIKVDLLTPESLSKYFKDKVLSEAEIVYER